MRGTMSGWPSAAAMSARPRTRARPRGSFGSKAGCGCVSSRYSRIASDWNSGAPPSTTSAGTTLCGLSALYSSVNCLPLRMSIETSSAFRPFRPSATRTRYVARDLQKPYSFICAISLATLDVRFLDQAAELIHLSLDEGAELRGRAVDGLHAEVGELALDRRVLHHLHHVLVILVDDGLRRARGEQHAPPVHDHQPRHRRIAGRQLGQQHELLRAGRAQRPQLAGADVLHRRQRVGEDEMDLLAEQVLYRQHAALVRNFDHVGLGEGLQHLGAQVRDAARAARAVG